MHDVHIIAATVPLSTIALMFALVIVAAFIMIASPYPLTGWVMAIGVVLLIPTIVSQQMPYRTLMGTIPSTPENLVSYLLNEPPVDRITVVEEGVPKLYVGDKPYVDDSSRMLRMDLSEWEHLRSGANEKTCRHTTIKSTPVWLCERPYQGRRQWTIQLERPSQPSSLVPYMIAEGYSGAHLIEGEVPRFYRGEDLVEADDLVAPVDRFSWGPTYSKDKICRRETIKGFDMLVCGFEQDGERTWTVVHVDKSQKGIA